MRILQSIVTIQLDFVRVFQDECNNVNYETSQICHGLWIVGQSHWSMDKESLIARTQ